MTDADHDPGGAYTKNGPDDARKPARCTRRVLRKINIGIDEKTLAIRAAEFATNDVGDAPVPPARLDQIPPDQVIGNVIAKGAFALAATLRFRPSNENGSRRKGDTARNKLSVRDIRGQSRSMVLPAGAPLPGSIAPPPSAPSG